MNAADFYNFIAQQRLAVLGTLAPDGRPQSALIGFAVTPALELIFDTVKTSRKYPNLIATPDCSLVMGWDDERTVQYEGKAEELKTPALESYQKTYFEVWPERRSHLSWPAIVYFVVRPTWIHYSGYDASPPLIVEFRFPPPTK